MTSEGQAPDEARPTGSGLVVVDKPSGWTSHQVVGRMRRLARTRKVGHAGTLDPMATGVLLLGVNRATRLLGRLALTDKEYLATIRLGQATVTDDAEGDVTTSAGAAEVSSAMITEQIAALSGEIDQVPSAVSAIKINGVRSYAKVRAGEEVDLAARRVTVSRFDLLEYRPASIDGLAVIDLDVHITCTSGTYIRALARDLGAALGSGGHLTSLRRTRVGPFRIGQARSLERCEDDLGLIDISEVARQCFPAITCDPQQEAWVRNGRTLPEFELPDELAAVFGEAGEFLALYRQSGKDAKPETVFVT